MYDFRNLNTRKKIFSGDVYGVQLPGIDGMFEVLEKHAPIVSALKAGKLKILKDKNSPVYILFKVVLWKY